MKELQKGIKRVVDVAVSVLGLMLLSPLLAAIALWIKLDSPGPVFYRGVRVGRLGRPFRIYKFRTMVVNADRLGGSSTADDDPRITRAGRVLRKYKLDELPQLLNVLLGEMSLVGPRPEVPEYVGLYTDEERAILSVRPGMTDWASLWNPDEGAVLAGTEDPDRAYLAWIRPTKVRLQLAYVRRYGLWTDMRILFLTVASLICRQRARRWVRQALSGLGVTWDVFETVHRLPERPSRCS
jgi:lipopolysaccharide/colanic/teichoic acid biosynthesis glycosyltransferase